MQRFERLVSSTLLGMLLTSFLASCNTTEALTPQVGIGETHRSSPVTQADTDRMASATASSGSLGSGFASQPSPYPQNSQNTLDAQARALSGAGPVAPAHAGAPFQGDVRNDAQFLPPLSKQAPPAPATIRNASHPPIQNHSAGSIRFLPIIGAPVQSVTPLSRRLGSDAKAGGLVLRPSDDETTRHMLKGYFSAFTNGQKVTVVYVWDILDNAGTRLHRMQGQEDVPSLGEDPWASVPASVMDRIGSRTIRDYLAWRQTN